MQNLLQVMMAADGHPEVRQKVYLLLKMIVNAEGSHHDCFELLLKTILKGVQDENGLVQSMACSALWRVLVRFYFIPMNNTITLLQHLYIFILLFKGWVFKMECPSFALSRWDVGNRSDFQIAADQSIRGEQSRQHHGQLLRQTSKRRAWVYSIALDFAYLAVGSTSEWRQLQRMHPVPSGMCINDRECNHIRMFTFLWATLPWLYVSFEPTLYKAYCSDLPSNLNFH